MAKATPEERYVDRVSALCVEAGVTPPADGSSLEAWREIHGLCQRKLALGKVKLQATMAVDKAYRKAKRTSIKASTEDRLAVQTDMAETIVLARLQRVQIEERLRKELGLTKPAKDADVSTPTDDQAATKGNNAQTLPA